MSAAASPPLIPSLPDDVAVNIIARVPRVDHATLSLVSKSFHSLLSSPLLFSARTRLRLEERSLYVTFVSLYQQDPSSAAVLWFTLHPTRRRLIPIPPIPSSSSSSSPPLIGSTYVALGPFIYSIGGSHNNVASPCVWILDCRFHKWAPGPAMQIGRDFATAGVVCGRIYVVGGYNVDDWACDTNWVEVLDPNAGDGAGAWETVSSSSVVARGKWMHTNAWLGGEGSARERVEGGSACLIDGVLYDCNILGMIVGFDVEKSTLKELKFLEKVLPESLCGATTANFGGNLVVLWEGERVGEEIEVLCAEIAVKKDGNGELVGEVLWSDCVLKVPNRFRILSCLAVSL